MPGEAVQSHVHCDELTSYTSYAGQLQTNVSEDMSSCYPHMFQDWKSFAAKAKACAALMGYIAEHAARYGAAEQKLEFYSSPTEVRAREQFVGCMLMSSDQLTL